MVWFVLLRWEQPRSNAPGWVTQPTAESVGTNLCKMSEMWSELGPRSWCSPLQAAPRPVQTRSSDTHCWKLQKEFQITIPQWMFFGSPFQHRTGGWDVANCLAGLHYCNLSTGFLGSFCFLSHHCPEQKLAPHTPNSPDQEQMFWEPNWSLGLILSIYTKNILCLLAFLAFLFIYIYKMK